MDLDAGQARKYWFRFHRIILTLVTSAIARPA
jgi:hypothetical protein